MGAAALNVIFVWHMHQPDYRDHSRGGEFTLPWVYLHAFKDYSDMAAHLERHPRVRCVVNFVPVLLDQLEDYADQFVTGNFRDPLLRLLVAPDHERLSAEERKVVLDSCFRSNHLSMIAPFLRYKRLHELFRIVEGEDGIPLDYLSGAYLGDLITWYHLTWAGETVRRHEPLIAGLMAKGEGFTADDRRQLADAIGSVVRGVPGRYRALAARGQIELSTTPQTHALAPLLIDFASARETEPEIGLPSAACYPGGRARTALHIEAAIEAHAKRFGTPAAGMWPAEGAVSEAFLELVAAAGCRWTAASETTLVRSLRQRGAELPAREHFLYRPYRLDRAGASAIFFRDEKLSDLIGFEYRRWHGKDAAADFVARLAAIRAAAPMGEPAVVTVILDGENAWEHFPYNAYYFFEDLYRLMESDPRLHLTTCSDFIADCPDAVGRLPRLVAGSWVYGTLSTWIGHPDKNRAWDLLCGAKQTFDMVMGSGWLDADEERAAAMQLAVCESSDWFWWLGDHNPAPTVDVFDRLYRMNLANLYTRLKVRPPAVLGVPLATSSGEAEGGGTMRRSA